MFEVNNPQCERLCFCSLFDFFFPFYFVFLLSLVVVELPTSSSPTKTLSSSLSSWCFMVSSSKHFKMHVQSCIMSAVSIILFYYVGNEFEQMYCKAKPQTGLKSFYVMLFIFKYSFKQRTHPLSDNFRCALRVHVNLFF